MSTALPVRAVTRAVQRRNQEDGRGG